MFRILTTIALVTFASASTSTDVDSETAQVALKHGLLEGVRVNITDSRFFYSFRGIPFAKPPIEDLRFKDPVPAEGWNGLRKGVNPSVCPQITMASFYGDVPEFIGEEDCLYLHVHTPRPYESDLPVMVFIHGGGFTVGDAEFFGGNPQRLLAKDIVLVSIQYRLGTLGFLSTEDSVLPGNLGLKDQTLALRWVQDNIHNFGGNPKKVTIFGESAGSASVHYQMLSPHSEGLFHRAIMQSGSALCPWAIRDDHAEWAVRIGRDLKCSGSEAFSLDSTQLLDCLMKASVNDLLAVITPYQELPLPFIMVPRIDGEYLPAHPAQLLREGKYHQVDLISGVTQHEAGAAIQMLFFTEERKAQFEEHYDKVGPLMNMVDNEENSQYLSRRILYRYADGTTVNEETADALQKMLAEGFMATGHDEATFWHGRDTMYGKRVYRYELQKRGEISFGDGLNVSVGKNWVSHADDLQFLFDKMFDMESLKNPDNIFLSDIMVTLWTNFASTGNPTPGLELGFIWDSMRSPTDMRFLSLTTAPTMKDDNRKENREFWRNLPLKKNKLLYPSQFI